MSKDRKYFDYFNFPITILQLKNGDYTGRMRDMVLYALHDYTKKLTYGTYIQKYSEAAKKFNVHIYSKISESYADAKKVHEKYFSHYQPLTGISIKTYWEFIDNDKSTFDFQCLFTYLALKSIVGTKPYLKITNDLMIARHGGYISKKYLPNPLPSHLEVIKTRYWSDKIKEELKNNWGVNFYGYQFRGFYFSLSLSYKQLVLEAEKNRINLKRKNQKNEEAKIRLEVINELMKSTTPSQHHDSIDNNIDNSIDHNIDNSTLNKVIK
jgi:hypothetical protein